MAGRITDVAGVTVGCWSDALGLTGCTVVLCPAGAIVAADVRGGAPGTRDTEMARPGMLVEQAQAILLAGGSAYGLDAAGGVMRWLEERGAGFAIAGVVVPIVLGAVVFDLAIGDARSRPGPLEGYAACAAAGPGVPEGSIGAGMGCTVGKRFGLAGAMRGGQGTAALRIITAETAESPAPGFTIGALMIVNAVGDIVDQDTGTIVAGAHHPDGSLAGPAAWRRLLPTSPVAPVAPVAPAGNAAGPADLNTTIGVVATDAPLTKAQAQRVAWMAHDGLARAVRPAHTLSDGDTLFVLATGKGADPAAPLSPLLVSAIGAAAADAVATAIVRAVRAATSLPGIPAAS